MQRVKDGSFDTRTTCSGGACTNPAWSVTTSGFFAGGLCGVTGGDPSCTFEGGAPHSPPFWFRSSEGTVGTTNLSTLRQDAILIPAAPASLGFELRIRQSSGDATGSMSVTIDGAPLRTITHAEPGFSAYAPVNIDASSAVGPGNHLLQFSFASTGATNLDRGPSFMLDDVSLTAPDATSMPIDPPAPPPSEPTNPPTPPEFSRTLSLDYSEKQDKFKGNLKSESVTCTSDQKVTLFEKAKGKDPKLGSDTTDEKGKYSLKDRNPDGKFYARVKQASVTGGTCLAAKSETTKVG